jgi:ABC-type glycerol-3-phosphate transport system substrate-binding protein
MRPFQIVVIAIFAVLALGSLYLFATFKGFSGGKPVGVVTIWGTLPATAVNPAIDDLKRTHQQFSKVVYVERDPSTFDADLADAIASGAGPDLIITEQERLLSERNKLNPIPFSTIPERTFRDSYLPIYELYLTGTGTYGIPFVTDPLVLYYNRTRLSSAGVPQPPSSWEAIVGLAPKLTTRTNGGIGASTIALGTYDNIPNARAIVSLLLLQSGSAITAQANGGIASTLAAGSSDTGQAPADSALAFYTQFADPAKIVYSWNRSIPDARQSFVAGDSAFYIGFASEEPTLRAANPNLDFDMTVVPQPQTSAAQTDYALAYAFAFPKGSANPAGGLQTAEALAAKAEVDIAAPGLLMAPALRSELSAKSSDIYGPIVNASALRAKGWLSPAPGVTDRIFAAMINGIISGGETVHDALVTADQSLNAAL